MKLKLQNILKVASADIELGGLTVITGENDSGKSTIGKILFSTLKAANNVNQVDKVNTLHSVRAQLTAIKRLFYNRLGDTLQSLDNIQALSVDLLEKSISVEELSTILINEAHQRSFPTRPIVILQKNLAQIQQYIAELDNPVLAVKREFDLISRSEFMEPLNSLGKEFSSIEFNDDTDADGSDIKMTFEHGELSKVHLCGHSSIEDVTYIESPVYLHILNTLRLSSSIPTVSFRGIPNSLQRGDIPYHLADMAEKILSTQDDMLGLFDNFSVTKNQSLLNEITSLIGGEFSVDKKSKQLFFKQNGTPIPTVSVASGIKSFGVLLRLIQTDCVSTAKMLVLDEPEIHLHPEWQIEFCRFIIELVS